MTKIISSQLYFSFLFWGDENRKKKKKPMKTTPSPGGSALSQDPIFLLTFLVLAFLQSAHLEPDVPSHSALSSPAFSCPISISFLELGC